MDIPNILCCPLCKSCKLMFAHDEIATHSIPIHLISGRCICLAIGVAAFVD
jgi:uncharacterized protein YbaR (Trm112 family)